MHRALLPIALVTIAASCAPDDRIALSDCDFGLYWADCRAAGEAGTPDPVLGCDESSGECRWFTGGATARGHAVSDCPASDVCCHDHWPFEDFRPSGEVVETAADAMGLLWAVPIDREAPRVEDVVFDLTEETVRGRITCAEGVSVPGCASIRAELGRVGESIVVTYPYVNARWELEILPGDPWTARLYLFQYGVRDLEARPLCNWWTHGSVYGADGVLHLSGTETTDLETFHGRLETPMFTMEF